MYIISFLVIKPLMCIAASFGCQTGLRSDRIADQKTFPSVNQHQINFYHNMVFQICGQNCINDAYYLLPMWNCCLLALKFLPNFSTF